MKVDRRLLVPLIAGILVLTILGIAIPELGIALLILGAMSVVIVSAMLMFFDWMERRH